MIVASKPGLWPVVGALCFLSHSALSSTAATKSNIIQVKGTSPVTLTMFPVPGGHAWLTLPWWPVQDGARPLRTAVLDSAAVGGLGP